jgi:hypothetical protein
MQCSAPDLVPNHTRVFLLESGSQGSYQFEALLLDETSVWIQLAQLLQKRGFSGPHQEKKAL